jgi:hypothetical protein
LQDTVTVASEFTPRSSTSFFPNAMDAKTTP